MSNEVRANYGELSNEQLVIRIKAGEDVSGNMEQLYNQVRRFIHARGLEVPGQRGNWRTRDRRDIWPCILLLMGTTRPGCEVPHLCGIPYPTADAPLPSDERQLFKVSSPLPGEGAAV